MRLINTKTYKFREFEVGRQTKQLIRYAILSHRWEEEEVTYHDMLGGSVHKLLRGARKGPKGVAKIWNLCRLARERDIEWVWIDTCCIDKSSSAELQEAVNSMYAWYQAAEICIAYLFDTFSPAITDHNLSYDNSSVKGSFRLSEWFKRGWTLQELIAPKNIEFYDATWRYLGNKRDLSRPMSEITGIPMALLYNNATYRPHFFSIAERMSWASRRHTTREEDQAYCLLGLFDVNMPLIYGEGIQKAFQRLQLEILSQSYDESIFCWDGVIPFRRILARDPMMFTKYKGFQVVQTKDLPQRPFAMTNKGLHTWRTIYPLSDQNLNCLFLGDRRYLPRLAKHSMWILPLNCEKNGSPFALVLTQSNSDSTVYTREKLVQLIARPASGELKEIFVQHDFVSPYLRSHLSELGEELFQEAANTRYRGGPSSELSALGLDLHEVYRSDDQGSYQAYHVFVDRTLATKGPTIEFKDGLRMLGLPSERIEYYVEQTRLKLEEINNFSSGVVPLPVV